MTDPETLMLIAFSGIMVVAVVAITIYFDE